MKCSHENIEVHDYRPAVSGIGIRCVECHAVMTTNSAGEAWRARHRHFEPTPIERKYFKPFVAEVPKPEDRLDGYKNWQMVRV